MTDRKTKVMVCPDRSGPYLELLTEELRALGVEVWMVPWFGKQTPDSLLRLVGGRLAGYRILHINWLPFNNTRLQRLVISLSNAMGIKVVWTIHNLAPHKVQYGSEEDDVEAMKRMQSWASAGVVHSERTKGEYERLYGRSLPIEVIHHGSYVGHVELVDQAEARRKLGIPQDRKVVLLFGPNRANKGVRQFLEVTSRLSDEHLAVLAGSCKDPELLDLMRRYREARPDRYLVETRFMSKDEAALYYAASDVFFMPFTHITTSGTILEAMSYGKAVVTVDKGDMYMLVRDGENGYLANTEEEMVERIASIDRPTAERMGRRSLEIAREYSWKDAATRYLAVFRRVEDES